MKKWIIFSLAASISLGPVLTAADDSKEEPRPSKDRVVFKDNHRIQKRGQGNESKQPHRAQVGQRQPVSVDSNADRGRKTIQPQANNSQSNRRQEPDSNRGSHRRDNDHQRGNPGYGDRNNDRNGHHDGRNDHNRDDRWGNHQNWNDRHDRDRHDRDRHDGNRHDRDWWDHRYSTHRNWSIMTRPRVYYPQRPVIYNRGSSVVLFDHAGWSGARLELSAGTAIRDLSHYRTYGYRNWNDSLSSLRIRGNVTVVLYTQPNFRGDRIYLHRDVRGFRGNSDISYFLDRVSSIRVLHGRQYQHGYCAWTSPRRSRSNDIAVGLAIALDNINRNSSNASSYPRESYEEPVSYERTPMVTLFDEPGFRGNSVSMEPDEVVAFLDSVPCGAEGTWNDRIASIQVQGGAQLYIYSDSEFYGAAGIVDQNVPDLRNDPVYEKFSYDISSVIVKTDG